MRISAELSLSMTERISGNPISGYSSLFPVDFYELFLFQELHLDPFLEFFPLWALPPD
jgi:hypothetical protein